MVERLAAPPGGLDEDRQLIGDLRLVDEVGEPRRAQRAVEVLLGRLGARVVDFRLGVDCDRLASIPGCGSGCSPMSGPSLTPRSSSVPALRSAAATSSSGSRRRAVEQLLRLERRVAEADQAVAGLRAGVASRRRPATTASSSSPATFSRSSTMIRSAVRLPIPGTAWKRFASPAAIARSSSRAEPPERVAIATFGPTPQTVIRSRKSSRSSSVAKP